MEGTLAEIRGFAGNFNPRSWALCQGQLLAINSNQALYSLLGTTYGGDGRSTFALPDLRGRTIIGAGQGAGLTNRPLGHMIGAETHTLTLQEMPAHNHVAVVTSASGAGTVSGDVQIPVADVDADEDTASGTFLAKDGGGEKRYSATPTAGVYLGALESNLSVDLTSINVDVNLQNTGAGIAFQKMKSSLVVNYIICTSGLFPSRS